MAESMFHKRTHSNLIPIRVPARSLRLNGTMVCLMVSNEQIAIPLRLASTRLCAAGMFEQVRGRETWG